MNRTSPRAERGQDAGQIALVLERRPRRDAHLGPHLVREQVGERGLAEAGRPGEQHVIERVAALARRLDVDRQVVGDLALADELGEGARAERGVVVGRGLGALSVARRPRARCRPGPRRAPVRPPSSWRFRAIAHRLRSAASACLTSSAIGPRGVHLSQQRLELARACSRAPPARRRRRRAVPWAGGRARAAAPAARRRALPAARRSSRAAPRRGARRSCAPPL